MPRAHLTEWSVQQRLALQTSFAICLAMMVGTLLILKADDLADDAIFDQQLEHLCKTIGSTIATDAALWGTAQDQSPAVSTLARTPAAAADSGLLYQVWRRDGTLLRQGAQLQLRTPLAPLALSGFSNLEFQGHSYRSYSMAVANGETVVQVAEQVDDRDDLRLIMMAVYMVSLLLPLFLTWRASRLLMKRALRQLDTLADGVARQDPHDASPMQLDEPPVEMVRLLASVNGLVQRAASVISREQQFTGVAAHELRSPLAGIRAQAQLAKGAQSQQELQQSLQAVMTGVDHAARVFDQLLDMTRMEGLSLQAESRFKQVDLRALCSQVHQELRPLLARKHIHYLQACEVHEVAGVEFALFLLLRNLLANAILYTPEHGTVVLSVEPQEGGVLLAVDDSGPGIAEADRQRVFERYCRLHLSPSEGIGLGLFIAQQAALLHNSQIELLTSQRGGLRAQVSLIKTALRK